MLTLLLLPGCHGDCGDYTVSTGVWPLDGDCYEMCGKKWGTFGSWNPTGDSRAVVFFRLDDRDFDRDVNGLILDMWVSFPTSSAVAGTSVALESGQLLGEAAVMDGSGVRFKISPLTSGELTITSGEIAGDVCAEDEGWGGGGVPTFGLAWDFVFENAGEETRFTASPIRA